MTNQPHFTDTVVNPFHFLEPYLLWDKYDLKGRSEEAANLLALLKWKDIIVVFGRSGVGKTSFVNYALSTRNRLDWLPVRVTRLLDIRKSLPFALRKALGAKSIDDLYSSMAAGVDIEQEFESTESIEGLVEALYIKWNRPIYLIIDQLEELFLIADKDGKERDEFLESLRILIKHKAVEKKVILVLREEHVGYIQYIERILTGVFQDALCIQDIDKNEADEVYYSLIKAASPESTVPDAYLEITGTFQSAAFSDEIKSLLIASCTPSGKLAAQKLQILLFLLWEKWRKIYLVTSGNREKLLFDAAVELCAASNPLKDYLQESVDNALASHAKLVQARYWYILKNSISDANTKQPTSTRTLYEGLVNLLNEDLRRREGPSATSAFQVTEEQVISWCEQLAEKRLLEEISHDKPGHRYFQLRHDILVANIKQLDRKLTLRFPKKILFQRPGNPYVGLSQYGNEGSSQRSRGFGGTSEVARLYGREEIVDEYYHFIAAQPCLVIVGDSGTGKSSLVKGGLLPRLEQDGYVTTTIQPGADIEKFEREIRAFVSRAERGDREVGGNSARLCLYIDQFEECYAYNESSTKQRGKFRKLLRYLNDDLLNDKKRNFKIVASIRHDYAHQFDLRITNWRQYKKLLRYPTPDEIFDIVVGPAYDNGVDFSPPGLPEVIAADAANTSYFLPLLSFAMRTQYHDEIEMVSKSQKGRLLLTGEKYKAMGAIVGCLQNEFKEVCQQKLTKEERYIFPQLIARMIVIKDTVQKARPITKSQLIYNRPGRRDLAIGTLMKFIPNFFRLRDEVVGGVLQEYIEPIHDSLLIYCREIRIVTSSVENPSSQMAMQPTLERYMRSWRETAGLDQSEQEIKRRDVVESAWKDLENLYELVETNDNPFNWLFAEEEELVQACKVEYEKRVGASREENKRLKEELDSKDLLQEKLKIESELVKTNADRKVQKVLAEKYEAESRTARVLVKARERQIIMLIVGAVLLMVVVSTALNLNKQREITEAIAGEKVKADSAAQRASRAQRSEARARLLAEARRVDAEREAQRASTAEAVQRRLTTDLQRVGERLKQQISEVEQANADKDLINEEHKRTITRLEASQRRIDTLKDDRILTLAEMNKVVSPSYSYRLAEKALASNAGSPRALRIHSELNRKPGYFESLILERVSSFRISRDGTKLLTVQSNPGDVNANVIKVWSENGLAIIDPIVVRGSVAYTDFSHEGSMILIATGSQLLVFDLFRQTWVSPVNINNLLYARFSENEMRLFSITNNSIVVYGIADNEVFEASRISFEAGRRVDNAALYGDILSIGTAKGISVVNVRKGTKPSTRSLPLNFILNDGVHVVAIQKFLGVVRRKLIYMDSTRKTVWGRWLPEKDYNLVTSFANTQNGNFGLIRFNQKPEYYFDQLQQQVQQKDARPFTRDDTKMDQFSPQDIYFIDFLSKAFQPAYNFDLVENKFILNATGDSVYTFNRGSIERHIIQLEIIPAGDLPKKGASISEKTRFRQVMLAGEKWNLLVSLDEGSQLKIWRYGRASELAESGLMWCDLIDEIDPLIPQN